MHKLFIKGGCPASKDTREIESPYDQSVVGVVHFVEENQVDETL